MKTLENINILENKKLVRNLNLLALGLLLPFALLFTGLGVVLKGAEYLAINASNSFTYLGLGPLLILILIIHELIHGFFFKFFCPQNKVKFGFSWKSCMAYATSPGSLYKRPQMLVIALSPFVVISLFLTGLLLWGNLSLIAYIVLAGLHAAGCMGDFYYVYLMYWKYKKNTIKVEDSMTGIIIYQI